MAGSLRLSGNQFYTGLEVEKKCRYGLRIEAPKTPMESGMGRGYPPPQPTRESGGAS